MNCCPESSTIIYSGYRARKRRYIMKLSETPARISSRNGPPMIESLPINLLQRPRHLTGGQVPAARGAAPAGERSNLFARTISGLGVCGLLSESKFRVRLRISCRGLSYRIRRAFRIRIPSLRLSHWQDHWQLPRECDAAAALAGRGQTHRDWQAWLAAVTVTMAGSGDGQTLQCSESDSEHRSTVL